ncbi:MAG: hypothetical protein U0W24_06615 [Bacteroidales bacterium]
MVPNFKFILFLIILFETTYSFSQIELLTVGTAKTIPKGHLEISLFRPARYGITKSLEVSAQPFAFPIFPNAQVKKNWYDKEFSIATFHGINYPTIALNMLRKRNKEGWIPVDSTIPNAIIIKNGVIASKMLKEATSCEAANYLLSVKLGINFAVKFKDGTMPPIQKPIVYPRTSVLLDQPLWYAGVGLDAHLNSFLNYAVDLDFLSVGMAIDDWAIENQGLIMTKITNSLLLVAGYRLSFGTYPEGNKFGIYPLLDISWTYKFRNLKKDELDLFKNKKNY